MERKAKAESAKSEPKGRASKKGGQDGTTSAEDNKRKREDDDMIEEFTVRMHDVLGNERLTLFGADALNAINYTMERVPFRQHRMDQVVMAFDLSAHFGLDGPLKTKLVSPRTRHGPSRQHIKNSLNRAHALQARVSDPDLLLHTLGPKNSNFDSCGSANGEDGEGDWIVFGRFQDSEAYI